MQNIPKLSIFSNVIFEPKIESITTLLKYSKTNIISERKQRKGKLPIQLVRKTYNTFSKVKKCRKTSNNFIKKTKLS